MLRKKKALITGVTGQDGSYLAEFLINKGYEVHGMKRRSSTINTSRVDHLYIEKLEKKSNFILHHGDMSDASSLYNLIRNKLDKQYELKVVLYETERNYVEYPA